MDVVDAVVDKVVVNHFNVFLLSLKDNLIAVVRAEQNVATGMNIHTRSPITS